MTALCNSKTGHHFNAGMPTCDCGHFRMSVTNSAEPSTRDVSYQTPPMTPTDKPSVGELEQSFKVMGYGGALALIADWREMRKTLRMIEKNYDCDSDSHKYKTPFG